MLNIEKVPVTSSNIEAIGYDKETETLRIWFKAGSLYNYEKVPEYIFSEFKVSPTLGSYFAGIIKGKYSFIKL